jgi:hypothetical protein
MSKYKKSYSMLAVNRKNKYASKRSDCGASGGEGNPGFQPGNTCGGDGDGRNTSADQGGGDAKKKPKMPQKPKDPSDKKQLGIAIDTLENPSKALMGGPSVSEAREILTEKFGYTNEQLDWLQYGQYGEDAPATGAGEDGEVESLAEDVGNEIYRTGMPVSSMEELKEFEIPDDQLEAVWNALDPEYKTGAGELPEETAEQATEREWEGLKENAINEYIAPYLLKDGRLHPDDIGDMMESLEGAGFDEQEAEDLIMDNFEIADELAAGGVGEYLDAATGAGEETIADPGIDMDSPEFKEAMSDWNTRNETLEAMSDKELRQVSETSDDEAVSGHAGAILERRNPQEESPKFYEPDTGAGEGADWSTVTTTDGKTATKLPRTEDGYGFYELEDGTVVDNLDPDLVDMQYNDISDLQDAMGNPANLMTEDQLQYFLQPGNIDAFAENEISDMRAELEKRGIEESDYVGEMGGWADTRTDAETGAGEGGVDAWGDRSYVDTALGLIAKASEMGVYDNIAAPKTVEKFMDKLTAGDITKEDAKDAIQFIAKGMADGAYDNIAAPTTPQRLIEELQKVGAGEEPGSWLDKYIEEQAEQRAMYDPDVADYTEEMEVRDAEAEASALSKLNETERQVAEAEIEELKEYDIDFEVKSELQQFLDDTYGSPDEGFSPRITDAIWEGMGKDPSATDRFTDSQDYGDWNDTDVASAMTGIGFAQADRTAEDMIDRNFHTDAVAGKAIWLKANADGLNEEYGLQLDKAGIQKVLDSLSAIDEKHKAEGSLILPLREARDKLLQDIDRSWNDVAMAREGQ